MKARVLSYPVILFLFFCSCQKEIPNINTSAVTGNLRAKINGNAWIATSSASASINSGIINIKGIGNHKVLDIILMGSATGTYILNDTTFNLASYVDSSNASTAAFSTDQGTPAVAGGSVTITKIDNVAKTITGTFAFMTFRSSDSSKAIFSEGVFENLSFTSHAVPPPPGGAADTLTAKTDSTSFTASSVTAVSSGGNLTIAGIGSGNKTIALIVPANITAGTYPIGAAGSNISGSYTTGLTSIYMSVTGSMTVLQHDTTAKRLKANFNFVAADLMTANISNITQGYVAVTHN